MINSEYKGVINLNWNFDMVCIFLHGKNETKYLGVGMFVTKKVGDFAIMNKNLFKQKLYLVT